MVSSQRIELRTSLPCPDLERRLCSQHGRKAAGSLPSRSCAASRDGSSPIDVCLDVRRDIPLSPQQKPAPCNRRFRFAADMP
jgi:hypothetical protein